MLPSSSKVEKRTSTGSQSSNSAIAAAGSAPQYVTELKPYDILLGRGAPIINYEGNVRFRELVSTRKAEYISTGRHQIKDEIARQIVEEIGKRNGRFLRKIESQTEAQKLGISEGTKVWQVANEDVAIEKVKQALRDKEPVKARASDSARSANLPALGSLESDQRSFHAPTISERYAQAAAIMPWLSATHSLPDMQRSQWVASNLDELPFFLQQQEDRRQQLALFNQHRREQQHLERFRQQQLCALPGPHLMTWVLGVGSNQLTNEELLSLSRQEAALGAANLQANGSNALATLHALHRSHSMNDIQLVALAALREQQQHDWSNELLRNNPNLLATCGHSQLGGHSAFGLDGGGSHLRNTDPVFSLLSGQLAATSSPSSLLPFSQGGSPLPTGAVAKLPSLTGQSPERIAAAGNVRPPSTSSDTDRKRMANEDIPKAASSSSSASGKEESIAKKPPARNLSKKSKQSSE
jgi:hypothetical protein